MFLPFSRENSLQVGTGLGLSIVKLLVEKMGGKLDVESEVGVEVVEKYFKGWLKVKELICEDKENVTDIDSKQAPIKEIEEIQLRKRKRRKVVILTRPCGPRKLEKAIVSVLSRPNVLVVEDNAVNRTILTTFLGLSLMKLKMELLENFKKALEDDDGEYPNRKGFESHTNACNERVATAEIPNDQQQMNLRLNQTTRINWLKNKDQLMIVAPYVRKLVQGARPKYQQLESELIECKPTHTNACNERLHHLQLQILNFLHHHYLTKLFPPLPSIPSSPTFPIIENNTINTITKHSRSLIFALTGLVSEEDKDLAFEVDANYDSPILKDCKGCKYNISRKLNAGKCLVYIEKNIATRIKGRKVVHDGTETMLKPYMTLENIEIQNELSLEENMKEIREMEAVNMKIDNSIEENSLMWLNYVIKDGEVKKVLRDFIINRIKGFVDKEVIVNIGACEDDLMLDYVKDNFIESNGSNITIDWDALFKLINNEETTSRNVTKKMLRKFFCGFCLHMKKLQQRIWNKRCAETVELQYLKRKKTRARDSDDESNNGG
ncbi:hypothetical protein RhiirB3_521644 [Rhizophagus irregularis]|nr:hypothetical protein RhiirB3_521644 [Rhizophagus irregularis]